MTGTNRVTVCNTAIEERQGGVYEYGKGVDEEVRFFPPVALDMVYGLTKTGTRRDFVAIRYVKGNSRRSIDTSIRRAVGWLEGG